MIQFPVAPVKNESKFKNMLSLQERIQQLSDYCYNPNAYTMSQYRPDKFRRKTKKLEYFCGDSDLIIHTDVSTNNLVTCIHMAFSDHYSLELSPDDIWLLIVQQLAIHINQNAESLRHLFVTHSGKELIDIRADDFIKGKLNDWSRVIGQFGEQIEQRTIDDIHQLVVTEFTTSTPITKTVTEICLMDTMQSYFDFSVSTMCGIPNIRLMGTVDDWKLILSKINQLSKYKLTSFVADLTPIIQEFVNVFENKINFEFWDSIYKYHNMSGGDLITGWINKFFPYITTFEYSDEKLISKITKCDDYSYLSFKNFTSGLSNVPFIWNYLSETYKMQLTGGFIGVGKTDDGFIRPVKGYYITEKSQ
jgi:hypothetical protein